MKIVEKVLEWQIRTQISLNEMQFGFKPKKEQWMQYLLWGGCRRNIKNRIKSYIFVF